MISKQLISVTEAFKAFPADEQIKKSCYQQLKTMPIPEIQNLLDLGLIKRDEVVAAYPEYTELCALAARKTNTP